MTKRALVILNPISGAGRGKKILPDVLRVLEAAGWESETLRTGARGDAEQKARELRGEIEMIVTLGGDGTISEVVAGLEGADVPVCIVPVGTSNCLAGELKLSPKPDALRRRIEAMRTEVMDSFIFNGRRGLLMAGAGLDGEVARRVCERRKGHLSQFSYCIPSLKTIVRYPFHPMSLTLDGEKITDDANFVEVANIRQYGGPMVLVDSADRADGLLDVLVVEGAGRLQFLSYMSQAFVLKRVKGKGIRFLRGRKILLESEHKVPYQVDGDYCASLPVEIEIVPASLKLIVNPE